MNKSQGNLVGKMRLGCRGIDAIDKVLFIGGLLSLLVFLVGGVILTSLRTHADTSSSTTTSVTVTSSCQMIATADTAHEAEVVASTYQSDIGKTTITATCNDANGFAVYAVGYTNTEFGRNDMLGENTGRTIATGTATSGNTSNWAMKLTAVAGADAPTIATGYNAYHAVPDEYTKVASYSSNTTNNAVGSKFETTYAAFIESGQLADTYNGKVRYTLVHPSDSTNTPCAGSYVIAYNANGGSGSMDSQTVCADANIALLPNGFTPPVANEYQFASWNTAADGSGYTYYPGQSVMNLASIGDTVTMYAQWAPKYMQDLTRATCAIAANEAPYTVYDRRDGNTYTVRYIEGACWMTQNLRITGTVNKQYSNFSTYDNVNVCEGDLTSGNSYDEARCHNSGNTSNGVWYNYAAASAKTITGTSNSTVATEDICPAGWHLPSYDKGNTAGSINSLSSTSATSVGKFSPVTGGLYGGGSLYYTGDGYWWSTTANGTDGRYSLFCNGSIFSTSNNYRYNGVYIRCVR